jgi:hypothetical protein
LADDGPSIVTAWTVTASTVTAWTVTASIVTA